MDQVTAPGDSEIWICHEEVLIFIYRLKVACQTHDTFKNTREVDLDQVAAPGGDIWICKVDVDQVEVNASEDIWDRCVGTSTYTKRGVKLTIFFRWLERLM